MIRQLALFLLGMMAMIAYVRGALDGLSFWILAGLLAVVILCIVVLMRRIES